MKTRTLKGSRRQRLSWMNFFLPIFACLLICQSFNGVAHGKEIEATSEWTLLGENDTVAAGVHVRMDLTTGEKWVKTIDENENDAAESQPAADSTMSSGLAVAIDANGNVEELAQEPAKEASYDYAMMHQALSNLPPEEKERMGGLPQLPDYKSSTITPEQRAMFEKRMKEIWEQRQAELKAFQEEFLADLPKLLKDRIAAIKEYLEDPITQLKALSLDASRKNEHGEMIVSDILAVLQDLEYQLTDLDMARDFYTLGGWPLLSSLLADAVHENRNTTQQQTLAEEDWNKVNAIQAHSAWVIGTAVKNTEEFMPFATVEVEVPHKNTDEEKLSTVKTTALDLVLAQFVASCKAALETTRPKDDYYDIVMMKVQKTLYALGALLRANRQAQTHFSADQGPTLLAQILSVMADQAQQNDPPSLPKDSLKVVQRLLSLAQDIVMDITLHASKSEQVDGAIRKAFSSSEWCNAILRFVPIPRLYETTLLAIQELAPHCDTSWNSQEVAKLIKQPPSDVFDSWLPDGLDEEVKEERMNLLESTIHVLQKGPNPYR